MGSYQRALMILKMKSKSGFFREKLHVHYVDSKSWMEALSCQRFLTVCSQSLARNTSLGFVYIFIADKPHHIVY